MSMRQSLSALSAQKAQGENVELFTSASEGGFTAENCTSHQAVPAADGNFSLKIKIAPAQGHFCRLDLGSPGKAYSITCMELAGKNGASSDLLSPGKIKAVNAFNAFLEEDSVLLHIPSDGDPQLHFTLEGADFGEEAVLRIVFTAIPLETAFQAPDPEEEEAGFSEKVLVDSYRELLEQKNRLEQKHHFLKNKLALLEKMYSAVLNVLNDRNARLNSQTAYLDTMPLVLKELLSSGGAPAELSDYELVKNSRFFNAQWYAEVYPDITASGMDPVEHFLNVGHLENRMPSPIFDTQSYKAQNPDIPPETNALVHYLRNGMSEGRAILRPEAVTPVTDSIAALTGLFDENWYRRQYPDLATVPDVLHHFMNYGWNEGREPSEKFSVGTYNNFNPDIKFLKMQPLRHFIDGGIVEHRKYEKQSNDLDYVNACKLLSVEPLLYDGTGTKSLPAPAKRSIAVHLHLFNAEKAEYFIKHLQLIPEKFDLFVSLSLAGKTEYYTEYFRKSLPMAENVEVINTPNRGRNIAPLIAAFGEKLVKYDIFCHLHMNLPAGESELEGWLDYIMEHLFGTPEQISYIFSLLSQNDRIVFPPAYKKLPYDDTGWGEESSVLKNICAKTPALSSKNLPDVIEYVRGGMFWARGSAMAEFLELPLSFEDFPEEKLETETNIFHLLERLTLVQTASGSARADMLFLKSDVDDLVKYRILSEKMKKYGPLFERKSDGGMKLILASHDSDRSGAPILALNIAKTLKSMGYQLFIILLKKGELYAEFEKCGTVQLFDTEDLEKLSASLPILKKAGYENALLNTVLCGALAPFFRAAGIVPVTLIHEMGYSVGNYCWQDFARLSMESEKIVMPSSAVAESWKKIGLEVPAEILVINPQGDYWKNGERTLWDKEESRQYVCKSLQLPEDARIVLCAALVEKRKGVEAFVQTAEKLRGSGIYFVWVGATPERMFDITGLNEKIASLDNCIFTEFKKDLDRYIAGADIFFLPSLADPFPAVSLLATSQGTPIVLCDGYTGSSDFCKNFSAGLVTEYSADAFAQEIERLVKDRELHKKVSQESLEFSCNFHSMRQYLIEVLGLYPGGLKKVTCIVPNYQYEKYLPERLGSILKQSYPIYDIVFLDDRSSDNSLAVAEKILKEGNADYRIIANEENSGSVFKQWFKGIEAAKGDFVWIAEADDACSPEFLSKVVPAFEDDAVCLSYAQSCLMDGDSKVYNPNFKTHTDSISRTKWTQCYTNSCVRELNDGLAVKNTIPNASAIVIRKSAAGKIDKDLLFQFKVAGDWIFYLELLKGGRVAYTPAVLNYYRRHGTSVVNKNMERNCREFEMVHRYILENFPVNNRMILKMQDEFERMYNGYKTAFSRTLDYASFIKERPGEVLMFVTDDMSSKGIAAPEFLKSCCEEHEVWLVDANMIEQHPGNIDNLPESVTYCRLQDLGAGEKPKGRKIIVVTDLKSEKLPKEVEALKHFISADDVFLTAENSGENALSDEGQQSISSALERVLHKGKSAEQ